ncbi:DHH family phosphoesterase [Metabacillus fastidiosus]|uniref:DHH family phosphoesterase n=1 Tax=Metabacillus fastidiosus TaxID=1458 RepID=UPI003D275BDF
MKYRLIGENNYLNPIETALENREIDNVDRFLNPSEEDIIHYSNLINIGKAVDKLIHHIEKGGRIFIQVDSDPDGYTSATLLIDYLKRVFRDKLNLIWRLHEGKEHGLILDTIPNEVSLVITPDSGSNDYDHHKYLKQKGIDVIILDHHDCEEESKDAIVVNSQISPNYHNKQLSGVGIVYKFLQALDDKLNLSHADDYLDLVAIGNIADSQDMRSLETRYYVNKGLSNIKNKLLKALYDKQAYSTKGKINIKSTEFYINPLINACIRVGSMEEKTQMMNAFLESDEKIYYKRNDVYEDIEVNTARMLTNIKSRQGRIRDKGVDLIEQKIKEKNLLDNKLLIVNVTDVLDKNLTGLVANSLKDKYKRGTLLVRHNEKEKAMTGSIRGYDKGELKDLKGFLQDTGKFDFVEGHANAAGLKIQPKNLIAANEIINEKLKDMKNDDAHDVDFIFTPKQLTKKFIKEIHKYEDIWGFKVEEPLITVKDIEVNTDEIYLNGKTSKTLKFENKRIQFIKYYSNKDEWNALKDKGERLIIDVVGRCSVNEYKGKTTHQIVIEDYEVTMVKEKELIF